MSRLAIVSLYRPCGLLAVLGLSIGATAPVQAQQGPRPVRIALSPLELAEVHPDSSSAFEARLATALAASTDSASVKAADVVARQLEEMDIADAWTRTIFTFATTGIVDPVDLTAVCHGLHVDQIVHIEVAEVVEGGPVHAHGQVLLSARVTLRAWQFDCASAGLARERWAEGKHDIVLSGSVETSWSLVTEGAVSAAIDVLIDGLRPWG